MGASEASPPPRAQGTPSKSLKKVEMRGARVSERGGVAELRRTSEQPSNEADRPFQRLARRR